MINNNKVCNINYNNMALILCSYFCVILVPIKDKIAVLHCTVTLIDCAEVKLLEFTVQRSTDPSSLLVLWVLQNCSNCERMVQFYCRIQTATA